LFDLIATTGQVQASGCHTPTSDKKSLSLAGPSTRQSETIPAVYVSQPQAVAHLIEKAATGALVAGQ